MTITLKEAKKDFESIQHFRNGRWTSLYHPYFFNNNLEAQIAQHRKMPQQQRLFWIDATRKQLEEGKEVTVNSCKFRMTTCPKHLELMQKILLL